MDHALHDLMEVCVVDFAHKMPVRQIIFWFE